MRTLLTYLAAGKAPEEIDADFPSVSPDALRAVLAFAAATPSKMRVTRPTGA